MFDSELESAWFLHAKRSIGDIPKRRQAFRIVAVEILCRRPAGAGIFPFGLGWQTIRHPFFAAHSTAEFLSVVPGDVHHGALVGPRVTGVIPGVLRAATFQLIRYPVVAVAAGAVLFGLGAIAANLHERRELADRRLESRHIERLRDRTRCGGRSSSLRPSRFQYQCL